MTQRIRLPAVVGSPILDPLPHRAAADPLQAPSWRGVPARLWLAVGLLSVALTAIAFGRVLGYWFTGLDAVALVGAAEVHGPNRPGSG